MDFLNKTRQKSSKTEKKRGLPSNVNIWNSLDAKFQPKLTTLNFWTELTQKGYFWSRKE